MIPKQSLSSQTVAKRAGEGKRLERSRFVNTPADKEQTLPMVDPVDVPTAPGLPEVLKVDEVAALLRVERKTLYDAIARGEIPGARRIGRLIRISRTAVLRWLGGGEGDLSVSSGR